MQYVTRRLSASCFICRHYGDMTRVLYKDILYFTSSNQYTEIHTAGSVYRQAEPLKRVAARLPIQFIQCHRTAVVNIDHVEKLAGSTVYLDSGETLPVSKTYLDSVRALFLKALTGMALDLNPGRSFSPALRTYISCCLSIFLPASVIAPAQRITSSIAAAIRYPGAIVPCG